MANVLEVKQYWHNRKGPNNLTCEGRQGGIRVSDPSFGTKSSETDGETTPELPHCSLPCCSNKHVKRETNLWRKKKKNYRKTGKGGKSYLFYHCTGFTVLQCLSSSEPYFSEQILYYFFFWPQAKVLKTGSFRTSIPIWKISLLQTDRQGPILFGCAFVHS